MAFRKLQLNLLSQSGELINCISCFAGQVAVFRASSYAALEVYQRALAGIPGPERVSIFLDDQSLIPSEHFFVGFGEHRELAHEPVLDSFLNLGVGPEILNTLQASYDIAIEEDTPWGALTKCEARRARLLLATKTTNQVIILNDPFEPLANQWRERFAELIANFARHSKAIVVVTNLSSRPESWIDNQSIARIQVGEEIQRTIGFGAQSGKANDLVSQIREIMKDDAKVAELLSDKASPKIPTPVASVATFPTPTHAHAVEQTSEEAPASFGLALGAFFSRIGLQTERLENSQRLLQLKQLLSNPFYSALVAGSVIVGGGIYLMSPDEEPVQVAMTEIQQPHVAPVNDPAPAPERQDSENTESTALNQPPSEIPAEQPKPAEPVIKSVLDEYPETIKKSILVSFQGLGRSSASNGNQVTEQTAPKSNPPQEEAGELLKLLATASDTGEGLPDSPPPSAANDEESSNSYRQGSPPPYTSEEEKREAIRKRFLEAIERAQNMKRQQVADQSGE